MNFTLALSSIGFVGRFIIAFIILAYLYSNNKIDQYIRKGFKTLCISAAVVLALSVLALMLFFTIGGIGLLGSFFNGGHHSFTYNLPF